PALLLLGAVLAVAITVAVAVALQRLAVGPFVERGNPLGWIAATAAAGLLLRSLIGLGWRAGDVTVPDVLAVARVTGAVSLPGGGSLAVRDIAVLAVAVLLAVAFDRWLAVSRTGAAMRAVADSRQAAMLVGITPARVALLAFGIAGLLAAVAAMLLGPARPFSLDLGVVLGLKGVAAAVLGRLGSARGALLAGLGIGVGESFLAAAYLPALYDIAPVALLVLLLALAPRRLGVGRSAEA
ncbi:MAG: branched-chain amino acid transport system permease protein, partial [Chloroflexota bacterium]|nr:branched-chain amino acid transport system permease protein [Chloroflexota bacterium]